MDADDVKTGEDALLWIAAYRRRNSKVLTDLERERLRREELADLDDWEQRILAGTALTANDNN